MPVLSTGPIDNPPVGDARITTQLVVRLTNGHSDETVGVLIQGYTLGATSSLYVSEFVSLAPEQTAVRTYFANLDGVEFRFIVDDPNDSLVGIFVSGKQANGELNAVHRLVTHELTPRA
ncbi:hypothetical protein [Gorillibacterium sp. sgz500922]|uniref:hypothetical protein n=1 Tax=Gorillibacterium sp. sgz500922 TaxID=3446694 RepID=UPI003F675C86